MKYFRTTYIQIAIGAICLSLLSCRSTKIYKFDDYDIKYLGTVNEEEFTFFEPVNEVVVTILNGKKPVIDKEGFIVHAKKFRLRRLKRFLKPLSKCSKW